MSLTSVWLWAAAASAAAGFWKGKLTRNYDCYWYEQQGLSHLEYCVQSRNEMMHNPVIPKKKQVSPDDTQSQSQMYFISKIT